MVPVVNHMLHIWHALHNKCILFIYMAMLDMLQAVHMQSEMKSPAINYPGISLLSLAK